MWISAFKAFFESTTFKFLTGSKHPTYTEHIRWCVQAIFSKNEFEGDF